MESDTKIRVEKFIVEKLKKKEWWISKDGDLSYQVKQINEMFPSTYKKEPIAEQVLKSTIEKIKHKDNPLWIDYKKLNKLQEDIITKQSKITGVKMPKSNSGEVERLKRRLKSMGLRFSVSFQGDRSESKDMSANNITGMYKKLIGDVNLKKDEQFLKDILPYRKKVIQYRTTALVTLYGTKGMICDMSVIGVLPEFKTDIINFWIGREIDTYGAHFEEFRALMMSMGANNVVIGQYPLQKDVVTNVGISMSFR